VTTSGTNLTINPNGNIGIGTSSANYLFSVYGTDTVLFNNRPAAGNRFEIQVGNSTTRGSILGFDPDGATSFGYLRTVDTAANYSTISWNDSKVGIGNVVTPTSTLDVGGLTTIRNVNSVATAPSHLLLNNNGGTATVIGWQASTGLVAAHRVDNQGNIYQYSDTNNFFYNADTTANATAGSANFYTDTAFMTVVGNVITFPGSITFGSAGTLTFAGSNISSTTGNVNINSPMITQGIIEAVNLITTAPLSPVNMDFLTSSVLYYTAAPTANMTLNIRGNASTTLNSVLSVGQSINLTVMLTNISGTFYFNAYTIDSTSVTPKYPGGIPVSTGYAGGIDIYSLAIIKIGNNSFQLLVTQSHYG
jgi:hypothetical protein